MKINDSTNESIANVKLGYYAPPLVYAWWKSLPAQTRSETVTRILLSAIAPDSDPLNEMEKRLKDLESCQPSLEAIEAISNRVKRIEKKLENADSY
jgi:hypothetical protein